MNRQASWREVFESMAPFFTTPHIRTKKRASGQDARFGKIGFTQFKAAP
jgi:uncharacterized membrane protein